MPYLPRCRHDARQIANHVFECTRCGTMFVGIDQRDPNLSHILSALNGRDPISNPSSYNNDRIQCTNAVHIDLGTIPQDILDTKNQLKEMEKALSLFAEVLKNVVQA